MGQKVIAIDCGGTNIKAAIVNQEGQILECKRRPSEAQRGIGAVVENLAGLIKELAQEHQVSAVTLGIAGVINLTRGIITQSPNIPGGVDFPIRQELLRLLYPLDLPVLIENDANAYALGELWKGAGRDLNSFICLTIGTGVGGGIVLGRQIWRGEDGAAAEIGHMVIYPDGERCLCGNQGCLEAYASAVAIQRRVREAFRKKVSSRLWEIIDYEPGRVTPELLYRVASQGDPFAQGVWAEVGKALGIAFSNLINIFNPEAIIVGGGLAQAWSLFIPEAKREVEKRALWAPTQRVRFLLAALGDDAAILGAAYLVFSPLARQERRD